MSERLSDFHQFRNALAGLRAALVAPDVLRYPDDIVVELPYEAGQRFETWAQLNLNGQLVHDADLKCRTCDGRTWLTIDGIRVSWPKRQVGS
jgi:hypothetical protein